MPAQKEAVPSYSDSQDDLSAYDLSSNGHSHSRDPSPAAASHTMRHALREVTPPQQYLDVDDPIDTNQFINQATDGSGSYSSSRRSLPVTPNRLVQRHSASPQTTHNRAASNSPAYAAAQFGTSPALDRAEAGQGTGYTNGRASDENTGSERTGMLRAGSHSNSSVSSFFPALPAIDSGEPLRWDGFTSRTSLHDPFSDSGHGAPSGYRSSTLTVDQTSQSRPGSRISSYGDPVTTVNSSHLTRQTQTEGYSASQQQSPVTPTRQYQPLQDSGAGGSPQYVGYFKHGNEAPRSSWSSWYSSRTPWGLAWKPQRSRSPTPRAGDDQNSHYSGGPRPPPERDADEEAEVNEKLSPNGDSEDSEDDDDPGELPTWQSQTALARQLERSRPNATVGGEKAGAASVFTQSTSTSVVPHIETRHFGPAPTGRVLRRHKTKKRVSLTNGNLVVDIPVPPNLVLPWKGDNEVMKMRYTAVTCDPDEFEKNGFFLRQNESGRKTELFICVTMYNVGSFF